MENPNALFKRLGSRPREEKRKFPKYTNRAELELKKDDLYLPV
jgi:hypothetical protein